MSKAKLVRFLDYDRGSLLVLTEDFNIESGWTEKLRPDFSWWQQEDKGAVGYSVDGLEDGPPDLEFLQSCHFPVIAPQFRLFDAGVADLATAAYSYFVEQGHGSHVASFYERSIDLSGKARSVDDLIRELEHWTILYHLYGHLDGLFWMGVTAISLGMNEQAVLWLERFLDCRGDHAWAHCHLGSAHYNLGNRQETRIHWEIAVCLDGRDGCGAGSTGAAELLTDLDSPGIS